MRLSKSKLFRYSGRYLGVIFLGGMLAAGTNVALGAMLGPARYGIFAACYLVILWGPQVNLGLYQAFGKQYPLERGREDDARADTIADSTFWVSMGLAAVVAAAVLGFALTPGTGLEWEYRVGMGLLSVQLLPEVYLLFALLHHRNDSRFEVVERITLMRRVLDAALRLGLTWFFGLTGLFVGSMLAVVLTAGTMLWASRSRFGLSISMVEARRMLILGFPIFLVGIIVVLFNSIGRPLVLGLYDKESLGLFAMGATLANMALLLPQAANFVLAPTMMHEYGRTGRVEVLGKYTLKPTLLMCLGILGVITVGSVGVDLALRWILPEFVAGILMAHILFFAVYFRAMQRLFVQLLIAVDDRAMMIVAQAVSLAVAVVLSGVLWWLGLGAEGVAASLGVGVALSAAWIIGYGLRRYLDFSTPQVVAYLLQLTGPLVLTMSALAVAVWLWPLAGESLALDAGAAAVHSTAAIIVLLPVLWVLERRTGLVTEVKDMVFARLKRSSSQE